MLKNKKFLDYNRPSTTLTVLLQLLMVLLQSRKFFLVSGSGYYYAEKKVHHDSTTVNIKPLYHVISNSIIPAQVLLGLDNRHSSPHSSHCSLKTSPKHLFRTS